jgi:hypothetical protein
MKIYLKRLVKGLAYLGTSTFVIFHEFGTNSLGSENKWMPQIESWAATQTNFVETLTMVLLIIAMIAVLIYALKGVFYLTTLHIEKHPIFEVSFKQMMAPVGPSKNSVSNLEKMQAYRDAKMSTMTNEDAAREYMKTAWVDSLISDNGRSTQSTKRYIDSCLSAKTNEDGYNWLKNH